jgi:hypothetical protein
MVSAEFPVEFAGGNAAMQNHRRAETMKKGLTFGQPLH